MATAANTEISQSAASQPRVRSVVRTPGIWAPYVLALFFVFAALRGAGSTDIIDTDAARHAMNGAFIYDAVRTGHLHGLVEYAKEYYAHLPALSMPYHPPVFPSIEALFFAAFGVKLLTARLAVAVCAGLCSLLLFKLALATLGNRVLALCVSATTLSLWTPQLVARDVMLECPAMALSLAALYCVRDLDRFTVRRSLLFGVLAAAAVWTKQHAVFVGAVPFLEAILSRRWRVLAKWPIWISSVIFGVAVVGLTYLSRKFQSVGLEQMMSSSARDGYYILTWVLPSYFSWIVEDLKGIGGVFAVAAFAGLCVAARRRDSRAPKPHLFLAWIIAVSAVLVMLGATSARYLFFALPAAVALGYAWLWRGCASLWGERAAIAIASGFAIVWFVAGWFVPIEFLRGPGESAKFVMREGPTRVLYAGEADGNFIFAVRSLDPGLQATVVPAGKLPAETFEPEALDNFCRRFGIDWVVFENTPGSHIWSNLKKSRPSSLKLERSIQLESSRSRWSTGTIDVYRFTGPPSTPGSVLDLPVHKLGGNIQVKF